MPIAHHDHRRRFRASVRKTAALSHGFSLVELMVTVAVVAIVAALALPSLTSVINNNRLTSQANELVSGLQTARSEAVRRNASVTLCGSADGSACATGTDEPWERWIILTGTEVLRDATVKPPVQVNSGVASITFSSDGLARTATGLLTDDITVCIPTTSPPENKRLVGIGSGSRVSTTASGTGEGTCQ